jgi:hypothetical protein
MSFKCRSLLLLQSAHDTSDKERNNAHPVASGTDHGVRECTFRNLCAHRARLPNLEHWLDKQRMDLSPSGLNYSVTPRLWENFSEPALNIPQLEERFHWKCVSEKVKHFDSQRSTLQFFSAKSLILHALFLIFPSILEWFFSYVLWCPTFIFSVILRGVIRRSQSARKMAKINLSSKTKFFKNNVL